jgi:hypothetical protein
MTDSIPRSDHLLEQGVLIALDRSRAKLLFAAKQNADSDSGALRSFLETQLEDDQLWQQQAIACLGGAWQRLHDQLTDPRISPASSDQSQLLAMSILGGRSLSESERLLVRLLRPDLASHVHVALAGISLDVWRQSWESSDDMQLADGGQAADKLQDLRRVYQVAAQTQSAVVFAVDPR